MMDLQSRVKRKPELGTWHLECCQVIAFLYMSSNAADSTSTLVYYRALVVGKSDDVFGEILGVDEDQLNIFFQKT